MSGALNMQEKPLFLLSQQQRNLNLGLYVEVQFLPDYFLLFLDKKDVKTP